LAFHSSYLRQHQSSSSTSLGFTFLGTRAREICHQLLMGRHHPVLQVQLLFFERARDLSKETNEREYYGGCANQGEGWHQKK